MTLVTIFYFLSAAQTNNAMSVQTSWIHKSINSTLRPFQGQGQ